MLINIIHMQCDEGINIVLVPLNQVTVVVFC